jgi:hypothetical protein
MAQTIFERLRAYHTAGQPLSELIAEACDVGDELVAALEALLHGCTIIAKKTGIDAEARA